MPPSSELHSLYQHFDRLIDLPLVAQAHELESLRRSGDPLALQLEGMLVYHQHQNPTESFFPVDEWMHVLKPELPGNLASDLRALSIRLRWDGRLQSFQLGHFSFYQCLSVSAVGATYRAHDQELGRDVVLLLLFPRWSEKPEVQQRFLDASRTVARVFDPHVAAILGTVHLEGIFAVVRQWIPGSNLDQWLATRTTISIHEILQIGHGIASGLQSIHHQQVLHGDLKPANIIQRKDQLHPVITDFGTATWISSNESTEWHGGTQGFVAPEILGNKPPSQQSDLYSLGVILQWMATGVFDRETTDRDWERAGQRLLGSSPDSESANCIQVLREQISALLAPDPDHRPRDAKTVAARFEECGTFEANAGNYAERHEKRSNPLSRTRIWKRRAWMGHAIGLGFTSAGATFGGWTLAKNNGKPDPLFIPGTPPKDGYSLQLDSWSEVSFEFVPMSVFHRLGPSVRRPGLRPIRAREWAWLTFRPIELKPLRYQVGLLSMDFAYDVDPGQAFYRVEGRFGKTSSNWLLLEQGTNHFGGGYQGSSQAHLAAKFLTGVSALQVRLGLMFKQSARYETDAPPVALQMREAKLPYEYGALHLWDQLESNPKTESG